MKKIVSSLAALAVLLMPLGAITASADEAASKVQVKTVQAEAGAEDVAVPIEITANAGIVAMAVSFEYDATQLELTKVENLNLFGTDMSFTPSGDIKLQPFNILMENALATEEYTNVGEFAILHFRVAEGASGLCEIKLTVDEESTFDVNMDNVAFEAVNGGIEIAGATTAPAETTKAPETTAAPVIETTAAPVVETTKAPETTAAPVIETTAAPVVETTKAPETTAAPVVETTKAAPAAQYSNDKLASMSEKDYEVRYNGAKVKASAETNEDGTVSITLTDKDGKVVDVYTVSAETAKGIDKAGKAVDLPQTGVNGYGAFAAVAGAFALLGAGAWLTVATARKKDEQ